MKIKLPAIVIGIVVLLSLVQLIVSHGLATDGEKLRQLEVRAIQLENESIALNEEINKIGSLSKIAKQAQDLGFVKATQFLHLTQEIPIALSH